ncbi:bacterial Ig-like domain-containing protein [Lactococcus taiwanensis]|uniref:Bacterial Ig-like domain-containing protein n=1 Tax=Lactococcus taiwanensis TaxID=1151742 RepID=A0AA45QRE8_9LACT|nr:bacterial Ig-like domain-containing protein [Lactococcus taiwanensis]QSE76710.1 bacterial Ig-like domain-containing protein [Lactococcus taiwanensis]
MRKDIHVMSIAILLSTYLAAPINGLAQTQDMSAPTNTKLTTSSDKEETDIPQNSQALAVTSPTDSNASSTKSADQSIVPDSVLRELINSTLNQSTDYEPTEADLLTIKQLNFHTVAGEAINDWTGLEKLTNLETITDSGNNSISSESNFTELISKINQLPNLTSLRLSNTSFNLSVLSGITTTSLTNIIVPFPLSSFYTSDFRFLEQVLKNPNLSSINFYYNTQSHPSTSLAYTNNVGSESLTGPILPDGYSLQITNLPQDWEFNTSKFIFNGTLENTTTIDGRVSISGPSSEKIMFGSLNLPYNTFDSSFKFVPQSQVLVNVHDSEIYTGDTWNPKDNFDSATSSQGQVLDYDEFISAGGTVDDSQLNTSLPGTYPVTYTLDGVSSAANITVKENKTAVIVHDSTVYVGDNWTAQDNFDSALDKDGNPVDFSQVTVDDSQADTSKAGTFDVTYTYDGVTSTATVTVKDKQTAVNVHNSTIYVGDNWSAQDNFDSALDKDGNPVDFSQVTVDDSQADTSKAGTFDVTYTYDGVTSTATVTVKDKQTAVNVHNSTIYVGDDWTAQDNFDSALDKDGNPVDFSQVTVDDSQADTSKAGTFDVTYTYDGVTSTATVTVKDKQTAVNVHNSTIYVGDDWTAQDNFDSALDKDGNPVDFSQVTVDDSQADTSKAGTFDVTYTYDGVTSTATVTVKDKVSPKPTPDIPKDDGKNTDLPKASKSDPSSTSGKTVAHKNNDKMSEHKSRKVLPQTGASNGVYLTLFGLAVLVGIVLTFSLKNKPRRK